MRFDQLLGRINMTHRPVTDPFQRPQNTINWAERSIHEGIQHFLAFGQDPGSFVKKIEFDSDTGDYVYKIVQQRDLPDVIEQRWTEALNNLRNSFDQSIFAACTAINDPRKKLNYPWADSPVDLGHRLRGRERKPKVPPLLWEEIKRQQPYPTGEGYTGGDDLIRAVATIANAKHTIGFEIGCVVTSIFGGVMSFGRDGFFGMRPPVWNPDKKEIELLRVRDATMHQEPGAHVTIFFRSGPLPRRTAAPEALLLFHQKAQSVLDGLKAECARINGI